MHPADNFKSQISGFGVSLPVGIFPHAVENSRYHITDGRDDCDIGVHCVGEICAR